VLKVLEDLAGGFFAERQHEDGGFPRAGEVDLYCHYRSSSASHVRTSRAVFSGSRCAIAATRRVKTGRRRAVPRLAAAASSASISLSRSWTVRPAMPAIVGAAAAEPPGTPPAAAPTGWETTVARTAGRDGALKADRMAG